MAQGEIFNQTVSQIQSVGMEWHRERIFENVSRNAALVKRTIRDLPPLRGAKAASAVVISAGPSVRKFKVPEALVQAAYPGSVIAVDGSLAACLQEGLIPDFVLTLDPHPTRIVSWFGDPDFEKNWENDDYFSRQDLDVHFRKHTIEHNRKLTELIDRHAPSIKLILCTTAPENVVTRVHQAGFQVYWWNPLLDSPKSEDSMTKRIYKLAPAPCINTGGTVGTAAWAFANSFLKIPLVGLTGTDLGYHLDTPITHTQTYDRLKERSSSEEELKSLFPEFTFPPTGERFYTDPTYYWYRQNFLQLLSRASGRAANCSGAGTLFGPGLELMDLAAFLREAGDGNS